ncbi:response regulator [Candidatus Pacearchaeota archaeon]|nr:response regulator [Candidatus Pacearchaeota archaeon]
MRNTILLADDTEIIRELQRTILGRFSEYEIEEFSNGNSLRNRLEGKIEDVSLVVTDNDMPGSKGSEIIAEYAGKSKFPFVLIYGGDEEIGEQAVRDGAFGYLRKPFEMRQYAELIRKALELSRD